MKTKKIETIIEKIMNWEIKLKNTDLVLRWLETKLLLLNS